MISQAAFAQLGVPTRIRAPRATLIYAHIAFGTARAMRAVPSSEDCLTLKFSKPKEMAAYSHEAPRGVADLFVALSLFCRTMSLETVIRSR